MNKNYVIKVTDNALIAETGGIVQGMSGSPILQEGKLVGAVTHVILLCGASVTAWCDALRSSFDEPPRSNLRSLADKRACRLVSLDYV